MVKLLLDTNVVIELEDPNPTPSRAAKFAQYCESYGLRRVVCDANYEDVSKDQNPTRRKTTISKLDKYPRLENLPTSDNVLVERFGPNLTNNDYLDMKLLGYLLIGSTDLLVSEDIALKKRAEKAGIGNRVLDIPGVLDWIQRTYIPDEVSLPYIEEMPAYQVNIQDPLFNSIRDDYAGFAITASWPINTEAPGSLHIKDKAAANSTIFLVCRPREEKAQSSDEMYWEDIEPQVANAVRTRVAEYQKSGISGVDLYLACFGPALEKFSQHWPLQRGTPRKVHRVRMSQSVVVENNEDPYAATPEDALDVARREVKRWRLEQLTTLTRISHNQVENDVFHGMRGVRGMACRVASSKRLRRAGMRVFSPPFCGRDGESLSIRARGGRRAPPPASCTRLHRAFTLVPGWPRSTGNPSSTGRRTRTPDESAAWTPSRAPGSGTGTCAASMDGSGAAWRIPEGS